MNHITIATRKFYLVIFTCVLFGFYAKGQTSNDWYLFKDKKTGLIGYKDKYGNIKISPKFGGFTDDLVFSDVIAVKEKKTGKSYYLKKNGRKFGLDSVYVWDFTYDHINENKIRFRDPTTDKVGFFNSDGKIVISAIYNDARPFYNSFALVTYNGKRVCLDGSVYNPAKPCEDWEWNGKTALIDINNRIIADDIPVIETDNIDWFKLKITKSIPDTNLYTSFKSVDDKYYSFLDYKKEFTLWFYHYYLKYIGNQSITNSCYKQVDVEGVFKNRLRKYYSKASFLKHYQKIFFQKMNDIKSKNMKADIDEDELNNYIYTGKYYSSFYTKEGIPNKQKYPVFDVVTSYYIKGNKSDFIQDRFSFIRTSNGYKLFEIVLRTGS